jgi:abortive infection bacteriophage resistance protein
MFAESHPPGLCCKARYLTVGFSLSWEGNIPPSRMQYAKPFLPIEDQVARLRARGMEGDEDFIKLRLQSVSYYRLSGYWHPFRLPGKDDFKTGTQFRQVWDQYVFDRRLRLLVLDAMERIEVAVRGLMSFHHSKQFGPFGYARNPASLPDLHGVQRTKFFETLDREIERSDETFVEHFRNKSSDPDLPIWMATEVMSFGSVVRLYRTAPSDVQRDVAANFGVPEKVFKTWLLTLNTVRNICAHHGRLWNRSIAGTRPSIPRAKLYPEWHTPVKIPDTHIFATLTICQHCLNKICVGHHWAARLKSLLDEYPKVPQNRMGFPPNWEASPIWATI